MKRNFVLTLALAGIVISACKQESFDERCEREAREYTERFCPKRLDVNVILDSIVYDKHLHVRTDYHTVTGEIDDSAAMALSKEAFHENAVDAIKKSIELKNLKDKGIDFVYKFRSEKSQKELLSVRIRAKEYAE